MTEIDTAFYGGSLPTIYQKYLVPLIFEPYAADLVSRLKTRSLGRILELAAGTGVVTRAMAAGLPDTVSILATDLNQAMLDEARARRTSRPVEWRQADAMQLPFDDAPFDAVVCQFGAMFFPDRSKAFGEVRRVLKPGGLFIISVWDRIEDNEFADEVTKSLEPLFPADPPRFLARVPHGYSDRSTITRDVTSAGFGTPQIDTVTFTSRAESPIGPAVGFCQGTPLRNEIEARGGPSLVASTDVAIEAVANRFGKGAVEGRIQAHVVTIEKA
jgi:SAM-dependent methyltransferase